MSIRDYAKRLLHRMGYDLHKFNHINAPLARRMMLLRHFGVTLVLDVGANVGQYATELRQYGYRGRLVSFEPLSFAFATLQEKAANDLHWEAVNLALGTAPGRAIINIADNPECSSLLDVTPTFVELSPRAAYIGTEEIMVDTLDAIFPSFFREGDIPFLKIDAQGFERQILEGAGPSLGQIQGVQLEMSLIPLYEGELTMAHMMAYLADQGFTLMSLEPIQANITTGQLLQVDGVFFRQPS